MNQLGEEQEVLEVAKLVVKFPFALTITIHGP